MEYLDLKKQYFQIKEEIDQAVKRVLDQGVFIGGGELSSFEKETAEYSGCRFGIGVNSGTDALFLSLKGLGIDKGDEVITCPFTFIATAEVIANLQAKPVFVDIDPKTFNIDVSKIEEKITKRTKAIIPVHLFGQMADMEKIMEIAKKHNLAVVEDAAQAIGAEFGSASSSQVKKAGSFGAAGCFSFFPSKNLGGLGDGGMIVTNNENLAENIKLLKNHGSSKEEKYLNLVLGINSRLDSLQAAVLRVKLKYLDSWSKKRAENAALYNQELSNIVKTPFKADNRTHIYNQYTVRAERRDELKHYLKEKRIPAIIYYSLPLHLQPAFKYLGYKEGDFLQAEKAAKEVLSLPIYPELSLQEIKQIANAVKNFYENSSHSRQ
ncbi:transcriptional regulator [Parcubacteria bacterium DG_72]|nr:MAG: transcriptional regulator [Parcubacteria bacterium DG_72]